MTTKAEYQKYAHECLRLAAKAATEQEQQLLLQMADAWTRVALVRADAATQFATDANGAERPNQHAAN